MAEKVTVACAQQQMRLFDSPDAFRREVSRFLNMARAKGAQLAIFPPLIGVMAASPRVQGFSMRLLKQAQQPKHSLWGRTRSAVADGAASLFGANFRKSFVQLLSADPAGLVADYESTFAEMARAYQMSIVAGSAYLPDLNGNLRQRTGVFGPDGELLGRHDKMIMSPEDRGLAQPGDAWHVVDTPAGRVGIMLGEEALYPEAGRVLAYQGAELLVTLAAVGDETLAAHIRQATVARAQDNRCFAVASFLVGRNYIAAEEGSAPAFAGKSGIYAPLEMTPRFSGVLVEMGTSEAEGLLTAELDRPKLRWLWEHGVNPVRSAMPMDLFGRYMPSLYASGRSLTMAGEEMGALPLAALPEPEALAEPEAFAQPEARRLLTAPPDAEEGWPAEGEGGEAEDAAEGEGI